MAQQRRTELDLYRMLSSDDSFRLAMMDTLKRIMRG
jgi:type I restriction enzyme R subunit